MMSQKMQDAFNEQMQHEFYSSYLYLSMSVYCDRANLPGLARSMRVQAADEAKHARRAVDAGDFAGRVFLDWFVQEQVEEETT